MVLPACVVVVTVQLSHTPHLVCIPAYACVAKIIR